VDIDGFQGIRPPYFEADIVSRAEKRAKNADEKELDRLEAVCRDLESLFIYMLMKEMRKTVPETKFIHGGRGEEIFRDFLDEEMSKKMAAAGGQGIGIAKMLYEQLSRPIISKMKSQTGEKPGDG